MNWTSAIRGLKIICSKIKNASNSKPTLRKKKDLKQNKGNSENPTRIAKKNQSGGIHVGLCRAETSSQKILMIGNLSAITGTNQKCLKDKRTFFEKKNLMKRKKKTLSQRKKSTYKQNRAESVPFLIVFTANVLKSTAWNYRQNPLEIFLHALQTSFFTTYKHQ